MKPSTTSEAAVIRRLVVAILCLLTVAALFFAKDLLLPIVLGAFIALALSPIVRSLDRVGVPAVIAAILVSAVIGAAVLGLFIGAGDTLARLVDNAPAFGEELRQRLEVLIRSFKTVKDATQTVEEIAGDIETTDVERVVVQQPGLVVTAVGGFASAGTSAAIGMLLAAFFLASGRDLKRMIVNRLETHGERRSALHAVEGTQRLISRYLFTITVINAALGASVATAFAILEMDEPLLWGVAAFLLNYMPFVGTLVGVTSAAAIALVTFDAWQVALIPPLVYLALGTLEGQVVTPALVGRRLEINVVIVLLSVMFWTWLWGPAGAFLAVPMLVVVKALVEARAEEKPAVPEHDDAGEPEVKADGTARA
ncbi:MAG: AI-2E family transporter [Pseudomonadota bacterium]